MGKHLVLINANKTSSKALHPTFPKILLKENIQITGLKNFLFNFFIYENVHLYLKVKVKSSHSC